MAATGGYWKHVWYVLEGQFELVLADPLGVSECERRVGDACSLAELLAHGLIRVGPVPLAPLQEVRDLCRTRRLLFREMAQHNLHIQKVLNDASLKVTGSATCVLGIRGRAILQEFMAQESAPESRARLEAPGEFLAEHHRFMLKLHMAQVDALRGAIEKVDGKLEMRLKPFRSQPEAAQDASSAC
ncbi:transposase [Stigmatella aurantiaca DW4/3-1]|nr:transposase [Stigmatella aurantiaca DW4/3-1]